MLTDHIDLLRESVRKVKKHRPFHIDAWVVLPEHLHCIWTLPEGDEDYAGRWREIKKAFSKGLPATEKRSDVQVRRKERAIWQRRYWEHTIRSEQDFTAHMDYVHYNPVKHGWAETVADWPYSTFHRWVEKGVYQNDWGSVPAGNVIAGERV